MYLNVTQTWPNLQRHAVWSLKLTNQQIGEAHVLPFPLWDCHPLLSRFFSKSWIVQICHGGQKNVSCIRCHLGAFGATQQTLSLAMFCSCDAWSGIWILWEIASLPYGPMAMFHLHDCWSNSKRKDLETWNNWKKPVSRQYVSKIREAPGVTSVSNLKNSGGQKSDTESECRYWSFIVFGEVATPVLPCPAIHPWKWWSESFWLWRI